MLAFMFDFPLDSIVCLEGRRRKKKRNKEITKHSLIPSVNGLLLGCLLVCFCSVNFSVNFKNG